jgi:hypothetical protein
MASDPDNHDGPGSDPAPGADEVELLAAFDRLSPQGSPGWALADSLRRLGEVPSGTATTAPWRGLPDDLWERGRAAKAGQRMMGDVVDSLAALMDANARQILEAGDREVQDRLVAAWDALRYLAARVDQLEARAHPTDDLLLEPSGLAAGVDPSAWVDVAVTWFGTPDPDRPIVAGESVGELADALRAGGHRVRMVTPRGPEAWLAAAGSPAGDVVLGDLAATLAACEPGAASGVVLAGPVDRFDLPAKVALLGDAVRAVAPSGTVVVLATDQAAWEERLTPVARDLVPGRPLHPDTWVLLLRRLGLLDPVWHRPATGSVHAVVGRVAP